MRLLITTSVFHPRIGGIETVARLLAREYHRQGHSVRILTTEPAGEPDRSQFRVVRTRSPFTVWHQVQQADAIIQLAGLRLGWSLLLLERNSLIVHQNWPGIPARGSSLTGRLRRHWISRCRNVCPSHAFQRTAPFPCDVVGNPYDDEIFGRDGEPAPTKDIIFVGRMVPEKGPDLLLEALAVLAKKGLFPTATLVGDGPLVASCREQVASLGLKASVEIPGPAQGPALARMLRQHHIMVVPSKWPEPFGIVALEGVACGCVVVGSSGGGLAEAMGPGGVTFETENASALAAVLEKVIDLPYVGPVKADSPAGLHLASHRPEFVARRYLELLALHPLKYSNQ